MALLEQINSMKKSGKSSQEIIRSLGEQGISPREINEALSQMDIKSAVSAETDMQPSIMQNTEQTTVAMPSYSEPNQEPPIPSAPQYAQEEGQQNYSQQPTEQGQYAQPEYAQNYDPSQAQGYNQYQQPTDIETIRDISSQIIEESIGKLKEQISSASKMKAEITSQMQSVENRLAKIENIIQQLQFSIIKRMGEYGDSISDISKEMRATQDSFSKVINPLLDKKRGISEESSQESQQPQAKSQDKKSRKSGGNFEDYLR